MDDVFKCWTEDSVRTLATRRPLMTLRRAVSTVWMGLKLDCSRLRNEWERAKGAWLVQMRLLRSLAAKRKREIVAANGGMESRRDVRDLVCVTSQCEDAMDAAQFMRRCEGRGIRTQR